ncbi:hypothetical protein WAI453_002220 [Rhynchosporium graminicola]
MPRNDWYQVNQLYEDLETSLPFGLRSQVVMQESRATSIISIHGKQGSIHHHRDGDKQNHSARKHDYNLTLLSQEDRPQREELKTKTLFWDQYQREALANDCLTAGSADPDPALFAPKDKAENRVKLFEEYVH